MDVLGNRGKCAQPCRLPYDFISQDKNDNNKEVLSKGYLLSTSDLCGLEYIPKLIEAGVMCFKVEGRMKSPEYVATVTRIYRKYIDLALSNNPYQIDNKDVEDLMQVFNRGNFSSGHLETDPNKSLVYPEKQNHIGIYVGNVSNIKQAKGHVLLNLKNSITLGDTIQFEKESTKYTISELMIKDKNITTGKKGQLVEIGRMKGNINIGDKIYKISSKELSVSAKSSYLVENKKVFLNAYITLKKDEPIVLTVSTIDNNGSVFDDINVSFSSEETPIEAKNKPIDETKIINQIDKTIGTIFEFKDIHVDLEENLFLTSFKTINELRRNALEEILIIAQNRILRKSPKIEEVELQKNKYTKNKDNISVLLNILKEEYDYSKLEDIRNVYIPLKYFSDKKYENTIKTIIDNFNTYIYLPTIIRSRYKNLLNSVIEKSMDKFNIKGFVVSNLGNAPFIEDLKKKYKNKYEFIGNYTLNVYNSNSINEYNELGLNMLTISPELDIKTIEDICNYTCLPQELIVYGRTPLMNTKYCFLGKANKCYPTCGVHCQDNKNYYLKDRLGLKFPVLPDNIQTVTTIYNSKITSIVGSEFNVSSYRIDILDENIDEINTIIKTVLAGNRFEGKNYTNGNLNREI